MLATALGFATPILASDVGGFGEVAQAGAARLVPPADAPALHAALVELLAAAGERERLAAAASALAAGAASWERVASQTAALYATLVS